MQALLNSDEVEHVYCLDRGSDAAIRVMKMLEGHGNALKRKATFCTARVADHHLGLGQHEYDSLSKEVDVIVHNASVNFNQSLSSFEHIHIRGVSQLLNFASEAAHTPLFVFISSISSISSSDYDPGVAVPEMIVPTSAAARPIGYAQAKQVAERLIGAATSKAGIPSSILRVGQIAGPVGPSDSGPSCNPAEWIPSLFVSSKRLSCIPLGLPDADWLPVSVVGVAVSQIALRDARSPAKGAAQVYHVVNQHYTPWGDLTVAAKARFGGADAFPTVPLAEWLMRLKALDDGSLARMQEYPSLKILPFYKTVLASQQRTKTLLLEKQNAANASEAMRTAGPVTADMLDTWMANWGV